MEVRKLTDSNDWLESERVIETAFLHPWDEEQSRRRIEAQAEGKEPRAEESWGLFDDSGAMVTSISTLRHRLSFGGKPIGAGEIHMVGSIPEHRGGGGVRMLMGEILRDFHTRGDALAVLIPFSCAFYRKFGFEMAGRMMRQRVAIEQLADYACKHRVTRVWQESELAPVRALWDAYAIAHDLSELRDDAAWAWRGNGDFGDPDFLHPERQRYTYVLWADSNKPAAYVRFSFCHEPDMPFVGELSVNELVWNAPQDLCAVLGFLYRMRAKVTHINFELADVDLAAILPESDRVEQQIDSHVMARLLDTEQLLRLMPHPYGTSSYILEVEDAFLPEVSGRWQVTYADGKATAVARTGAYPDLVVDETTASQLVLGRIGLADALYRPDTQVLRNVENLQRVFTRRTVHLAL